MKVKAGHPSVKTLQGHSISLSRRAQVPVDDGSQGLT